MEQPPSGEDPPVTILELIAAFVLVVGGAIGFTNAVEWLGKRLDLGQGAVGALLAAVGTALPESVIPVVALLAGGGAEKEQIAIVLIIGAPFLLGTLANGLPIRRRRTPSPPAATRARRSTRTCPRRGATCGSCWSRCRSASSSASWTRRWG